MDVGATVNGRYELLEKLGRGGMGEVYLARDTLQGGRQVALKTLSADVKESYLQYFKHEFRALSALSHPNLARVHDFGQIDGSERPFFTSEYVDGTSLLALSKRLDMENLYDVTVQVCRALAYIHDRGLIHHDIKPENILVIEDPPRYTVKLIDFGLVGKARHDSASTIPGTIHYIAPEIFRGQRIDRRSDLYSLGILLYQVTTGVLPFEGTSQVAIIRGHLEDRPVDVRKLRPDLPEGLAAIIHRLIAKEPSERFAGAGDVIRAVDRLSSASHEVETREVRESYILSGRLVGRDQEFGTLKALLLASVGAGSGFSEAARLKGPDAATTSTVDLSAVEQSRGRHFCVLSGGTGQGKTRLLSEFKYHIQLNQIPFFQGACTSAREVPLAAVIEVLRQLFGTEEGVAASAGLEPELVKILPEFRDTLDADPSPPLKPEQERLRLIDTVTKFLFRAAEMRPMVLAVTGLQWADEMTLECLSYLGRTLALESGREEPGERTSGEPPAFVEEGPRMLVCATLDTEAAAQGEDAGTVRSLIEDGYFTEIALSLLSHEDVTALIRSMLGMEGDPGDLARVIHERTGGNPLFVEEVMKALVEDQVLYRERGEWHFKGESLDDIEVPSGVVPVLRRRLDRLDQVDRRLLEIVSVFSRPAPLESMAELLGRDSHDVYEALERLAAQDILEVRPAADGSPGYGFRHDTLRDLVYEAMGLEAREELHRATGEALERIYADAVEDNVEEIARHFLLGRDRERGVRYGLMAGKKAKVLCANQEALELYTMALSLQEDGAPSVEVLEEVGELRALTGDFEGALEQFTELIEERPDDLGPGDLARLHRLRGETCRKTGDLATTVAYLDEGIAALGDEAFAHVEGIRILSFTGFMNVLKGDYDAASRCLLRALRLARRSGESAEFGTIYNFLGHIYYMRTNHNRALRAYAKSLHHSENHEYLHGIAAACDSLGNTHTRKGNYNKALEFNLRSHEIRKKMGDIFLLADSLNNIGHLYIEKGEFQKAIEYERECLDIRERIGDEYGKSVCYLNLGIIYDGLEKYGEAIASFTRSLEIREKLGDRVGAANALNNMGIIHRVTGQLDEAIESLEQSLAISTELGRTERIIISLSSLGEVYAEIGVLTKAKELLNRALDLAREHEMRHMEGVAYSALGEVARVERDWDEGEKLLRRSLDIFRDLGNTDWICYVDLTYSALCQEIGQLDRARQYVREASGIAQNLGIRKVGTNALLLQGAVEAELGREAEALEMLGEARDNAEAGGNLELLWKINHALGNLYRDTAKFETAEKHYEIASRIVNEMADRLPAPLRELFHGDRRRRRLLLDHEQLKGRMMETRQEITLSRQASLKKRITDLENGHAQLLKLLEINQSINSEHNLENLLDVIMDSVVELSEAERGFLILAEDGAMDVRVARNMEREEIASPEFNISHSIAKQVMTSGAPVILTNAQEDERFSQVHSVLDLNLRSVLSFPFKIKNRVIGAIYLDNRFQKGLFTEKSLRVLEAFADQAAIAIENARLYEENLRKAEKIEKLNKQLEKRLELTQDELAEAKERIESSQREFELKYNYDNIIGKDSGMEKVLRVIDRVLDKNIPVLIQGESGTGKELIARAIHFNSPRRNERFVSENCAAISASLLESELFGYEEGAFTGAEHGKKGLFEIAHRGTMLLDEIGDMSPDMQTKLLRVLEEGVIRRVGGTEPIRVDVRILSATNRDLRRMVDEGRFREDLYYRVSTVTVTLPPLRERRQDIPMLVGFFLRKVSEDQKAATREIDKEVLNALTDYDWPGNVRELENEITRLVTLADQRVTVDNLSAKVRSGAVRSPSFVPEALEGKKLKQTMEAIERELLVKALEQNRWNKTQTAKELGLSRVALHKKLGKYGIK